MWDALTCCCHCLREEDEVRGWTQETTIVSLSCPICCCFRFSLDSFETVTLWFLHTFDSRNGYQKFSQEMLSNGELNHLPMKERMAEIGSRWQRLPLKDKDRYKKIAEEKQRQYKVTLEQWLAVSSGCWFFWGLRQIYSSTYLTFTSILPQSLSSQERNTYKEYNSQVSQLFHCIRNSTLAL